MSQWLFAYGSLIWRPGFTFLEALPARLTGYERRFWQGSHDHRGVPTAPGRVVTLVPAANGHCDGMAYRLSTETAQTVLSELDHREKNGYEHLHLPIRLLAPKQQTLTALVYLATASNEAYLGPAATTRIAEQILRSAGPSGRNSDYLFDLATALRDLAISDAHVFELETAVRALETKGVASGY